MVPGEQRQRSFRLTDDAMVGLDRLASRNRVTVTAMVEAFGRLAADGYPNADTVMGLAHQLDRERRSRRDRR